MLVLVFKMNAMYEYFAGGDVNLSDSFGNLGLYGTNMEFTLNFLNFHNSHFVQLYQQLLLLYLLLIHYKIL